MPGSMKVLFIIFSYFCPPVLLSAYFEIIKYDSPGANENEIFLKEEFFACDHDAFCTHVYEMRSSRIFQLIRGKKDFEKMSLIASKIWKKVFVDKYTSCKEALVNTGKTEGVFQIKHVNMFTPLNVTCKQNGRSTMALISHDSEEKVKVQGYENPGSYERKITYLGNKFEDIINFVDSSKSCQQFTRIDCRHMGVYFEDSGLNVYLKDRNKQQMNYFGGGPIDGMGCSCGVKKTCVDPTKTCNCDANEEEMHYDEGFVTEKQRLPLTAIHLGDTGHVVKQGNHSFHETGYHTIGKLGCIEY